MRDHLVVFINGQRQAVGYDEAVLTLAEYLRRRKGLVGTKVVCNEGDCGACSVLVGRLQRKTRKLIYQTVDACIVFLYQLDRANIVTVEGLCHRDQLTPIQDAMIQCHGSQCGFCTPGIVVAMHGMIESDFELNDHSLRHGLSGNLCRCTGYQQIFEAGRSVDVDSVARMDQLYSNDRLADEIMALGDAPIKITGPHAIYIPQSIEQACDWKATNPATLTVAGATDIGVLHNHGRLPSTDHLCLSGIEGFCEITVADNSLSIGGGSTWSQIEAAVRDLFPPYHYVINRFGSPQIRNLGTLAGNLATGSPIADSIPFHLVLESDLHLASKRGQRVVPLTEFYTGYRENVMADDELITKITTPLLAANERLSLYKISKRRDMDISTLTLGLWLQLREDQILQARLAIGGVGPTVLRIPEAEQYLSGNRLSVDTFRQAGTIAMNHVTPWSDVRGSADYRLKLVENLLVKSYYEHSLQPN